MFSFNVILEGKTTEVVIGRSLDFSSLYNDSEKGQNASLLVTDDTMFTSDEAEALSKHSKEVVVLGSGEKYKDLESVQSIEQSAVNAGLDRSSVITALGGGVICDITAFAASLYMRGCRLVLVPTTLLSMVDASIGGKSGVDFMERKNLIGSFYPAEKVCIDTNFLLTLSDKEYLSGFAEIIKHAFLSGEDFLKYIEDNSKAVFNRDPDIMAELIFKSLKVKAFYIEQDFKEQGIRTHLNLGHTFGHALEAAAGLGTITHGEAVAWGIAKAVRAGVLAGITEPAYADRVISVLRKYGYEVDFNAFDTKKFMKALHSDKKKLNGKVRFILQKKIGETDIFQLDDQIIKEAIK
ncbi:MAG: 3-dehydroquinate synthase [Spirochaetales bacterium]|nr:3-dehydroquinate synthase [Spirochaetales bacterium]